MFCYTEINMSPEEFDRAIRLARGCYQRDILKGYHNLAGSSLSGKAKSYSGHYKRSRENLLDRLTTKGIPWYEKRGPHGRRILVLGNKES